MLFRLKCISLFGPEGTITPLSLDSRIICLLGTIKDHNTFSSLPAWSSDFDHWKSLFHTSDVHQAYNRAVPFNGVGLHQRVFAMGRVQSHIYCKQKKKKSCLGYAGQYMPCHDHLFCRLRCCIRNQWERKALTVYCMKAYIPFRYKWWIWSEESCNSLLGCSL